jgi:acetoacetyl-CoA synthetase
MKTPLWTPSEAWIKNANITQFIEEVNRKHGKDFKTYDDLYQWSVEAIPDFWAAVWDFVGMHASKGYDKVVEDLSRFPGTRWFPEARLNFAENLLR